MVKRIFISMLVILFGSIEPLLAQEQLRGASHVKGKYQNDIGPRDMDIAAIIKARFTTEQIDKSPRADLPLRYITREALAAEAGPVLYRLGHSSVLIKLDGKLLLTDPVFSKRASPVQWAGPQRFHPVPIEIEGLPQLDAVIISHDHYDHLDAGTIRALAGRVRQFVVPLGVGNHLVKWGISRERIVELDWWQNISLGSVRLTATPAQHFSGRSLFDSNRTLWASWVIEGSDTRLFFSGDTGYFDGFQEIGKRFGPFDITMIETGAYNPLWVQVHMLPEQGIQAHLDLGGQAMLPIHNSTFDLSFHPWYEPLEKASLLAKEQGVELLTPVIGAPVYVKSPQPTYAWWREEGREQLDGRFTAMIINKIDCSQHNCRNSTVAMVKAAQSKWNRSSSPMRQDQNS